MLEGLRLCRALWTGKPVNWDGLWKLESATLEPVPHRPGGPPIWIAGSLPASLERAGRYFDGWLPNDPTLSISGIRLPKSMLVGTTTLTCRSPET